MSDAIDTMIDELGKLDTSVRQKECAADKRPYHFKIDPQVLHAVRSRAGKIGGVRGGSKGGKIGGRKTGKPSGRWPKGFTHTPGDLERVNAKLPKKAFLTLKACATSDGKTIQQFIYEIADAYRQTPRYAHLFAAQEVPQTDANQTNLLL